MGDLPDEMNKTAPATAVMCVVSSLTSTQLSSFTIIQGSTPPFGRESNKRETITLSRQRRNVTVVNYYSLWVCVITGDNNEHLNDYSFIIL